MIWALAAFLSNIVEQLMITSVIRDMNPIVYVALFYLFSTLFIFIYHFFSKKHDDFFDWQKAAQHKWLVGGFVGGAFFGNALWFASIFLIGVGMTAFLLIFIRVIITVYAYLYMEDRFSIDKAISFATGITMLLLFSFSGGTDNILGVVMALLSCFGFAMESITRKKLAQHNLRAENMMLFRNSCLLIFSWAALAVVVFIGAVEFNVIFDIPMKSFAFIVVAAFLGGVMVNFFAFYAMRTVKLSQCSALEITKPVFLALAGVYLLEESITLLQGISGVVIVLSSLYFLMPSKIPTKRNIP